MQLSRAYLEYLASDEWQRVRQRVFATRLRRCERCKIFGVRLDLHHKSYANFGNERDEDLELLCRSCHIGEHASRPRARSRQGAMRTLAAAEAARWRR